MIFDPSICGTASVPENVFLTADVVGGPVRVDDDPGANCAGTQTTFAAAQAELGDLPIGSILITQGFSGGVDDNALVTRLTVNGDTFAFDVPPAAGAPGAAGTTTIIQVPVPAAAGPAAAVAGVQARGACRGATVRRIRAPRRSGERFLRVDAALQTPTGLRALRSQGRTVTVDLRNRPEANYNVRLISRYRTKSGKTRRVVTRRNLSVACSWAAASPHARAPGFLRTRASARPCRCQNHYG